MTRMKDELLEMTVPGASTQYLARTKIDPIIYTVLDKLEERHPNTAIERTGDNVRLWRSRMLNLASGHLAPRNLASDSAECYS